MTVKKYLFSRLFRFIAPEHQRQQFIDVISNEVCNEMIVPFLGNQDKKGRCLQINVHFCIGVTGR